MSGTVVGGAVVEITMDVGKFADEARAKLAELLSSPQVRETVTAGLDKAAEGASEAGKSAAVKFGTGLTAGDADVAKAGQKAGEAATTGMAEGIEAGGAKVTAATETVATEAGAGAAEKMRVEGAEAGEGFKDGILESLKGLASAAVPLLGVFAGGELLKGSVEAADQLEGANIKIENVFGESGDAVKKWAGGVATSLRESSLAAETQAGQFGAYLSGLGVGKEQAAGLSENLVSLTQNMAAFNNADPATVQAALTSALRGRTTALKAYGVTLNANAPIEALQARGVNLSTDAVKNGLPVLTTQQKALGTLYAVMDATKNQQGALGATSDTLKAKQQVLGAEFDNFESRLGTALLPMLAAVAGFITDKVIPALGQFSAWFQVHILPAIKQIVDYVSTNLLPVIKAIGDWISKNGPTVFTFVGILLAIAAAVKLWAIAQALLNIALDANPLVLIAIAVAALGAGLVYAYEHSKTFRDIVDEIGKVLKGVYDNVLKPVADFFMAHWKLALEIALAVLAPFIGLPLLIQQHWGTIVAFFTRIWNAVAGAFTTAWDTVADFFTSLPGKIEGWLAGAGKWLLGIGSSIISGLWTGIKAFWNDYVLLFYVDMPKTILGYLKGAANWLGEIGQDIMSGLWGGITTIWNRNVATWKNVGTIIKGWFTGAIHWLEDIGKNIIQGLINGIEAMGSKLVSGVKGVISKIPGANLVSGALSHFGLAEGGLVTQPTLAWVGEAGPELVTPLSQLAKPGSPAVRALTSVASTIPGGAGGAQQLGSAGRPIEIHEHVYQQPGQDPASMAADISRRTARQIRLAA